MPAPQPKVSHSALAPALLSLAAADAKPAHPAVGCCRQPGLRPRIRKFMSETLPRYLQEARPPRPGAQPESVLREAMEKGETRL